MIYQRILRRMREAIRTRYFVMTTHAEEEMSEDFLSIFDIERVILTGQIVERQQDYQTNEYKYVVSGLSLDGRAVLIITKLSVTDKLVIITVFLDK